MGLKRKRSSATFSPSSLSDSSDATTTTTSSSPLPFFYAQSKPIEVLYQKPSWSFPTYDEGSSRSGLNGRTRKRHRDDRPEEEVVFENTMAKLYNAQRDRPNASPHYSTPNPPFTTVQSQLQPQLQSQPQRSTLHSFWRIAQQPPSTIPMALNQAAQQTRCEDCDCPLRHDEAMEIDEDVHAQETSCWECRRRICDACAVRGDRRVCLGCASGGGGMR